MFRNNRTMTYVMIGIVGLALALAFGVNPGFLLVLAICPVMMFFMMRSMGNIGAMNHSSRDNDQDRNDQDRDRDDSTTQSGR